MKRRIYPTLGIAVINDSINILNCGIKLTNRNNLKTRTNLANRTESKDSIGIRLMDTIKKSKMFQGSLKKSFNDFSVTYTNFEL